MRRVITQKDIDRVISSGLESRETVDIKFSPDDYLSRVSSYIPAEIVSAFVILDGFLSGTGTIPFWVNWLIFIVLLALTFVYTWRVTDKNGWPTAYAQIGISTASFFVWVFALGGPFLEMGWYQPVYGSILMILFTLIAPLIDK